MTAPHLSVIVPIYNEEGSIDRLLERLFAVLDRLEYRFEIITVNDGSRDTSLALLRAAAEHRPELKIVNFRRNYGQTAAMMAGIDHASGDIIVAMNRQKVTSTEDIRRIEATLKPGQPVAF